MTDSDRKNTRIAPGRRRRAGEQPSRRPRVAGSRRPAAPVDPAETESVDPTKAAPPKPAPTEAVPPKPAPTAAVAVDLAKKAPPASESDADPYGPPPVGEARTDGGRVRWSVWVLVAAAAILLGVIVVAAIRPGTHTGNQAWVDSAATGEVLDAAKNNLATVLSYNYETIEQDQENARAVLTGEMRDEYDVTAQATRDFAEEVKAGATAVVDPVGISLLDGDRAEVVAGVTVNAVIDGVDQGFVVTPVAAQLQLVDGQWLISEVLDR